MSEILLLSHDHYDQMDHKTIMAYGHNDITFMECGQANTSFGQIHMIPEKALQVAMPLLYSVAVVA